MSITDGFVLLILFTSYHVQIFNPNFRYFFRVLLLLRIHGLKQLFLQHFVKSFIKRCMIMLVFCFCSSNVNIGFFKQLCRITFKLRLIISLKDLWVFKHTALLIYSFQLKYDLNCFVGRKSFSDVYLNVTSSLVRMYLYVFLQRHYGKYKANQIDAAH